MLTIRRLFAVLLMASLSAISAHAEKPNIVLIMVDDLGFADLGCYGSTIIETPTLDRLASGGLRFSQFYNTAKCHSSRVSLLTGLYCIQAGDESMNRGVTLAEALKPAGYFTAMSGKWHLKNEPTERGFQRYFGHLSGKTDFFNGDNTFRLNGEKFDDFDQDFYTTDVMTDYALRFIDESEQTNKPFFLYLAYNAPHYPLQAPKQDIEKYRGKFRLGWDKLRQQRYEKQVKMGLIDSDHKLSPRPDYIPAWDTLSDKQKEWEAFRMAVFAAMVDRVDQNVARIVDRLEAKGELDNTLILFMSDNGACPFDRTHGMDKTPWQGGSHMCYDVGWAHAGNTPFRWYKQNQHEGGISSPMIAHWPAGLKTKPGSITHQPGHLIDIMATLLDVAGGSYPNTHDGRSIEPLAGKSLLPIFRGEQRDPHDWLYFLYHDNRAMRMGDYKLVSAEWGRWELYNLAEDRTELSDLADKMPEKVAAMKKQWHHVAEHVDRAPKRLRRPVHDRAPKTPYKRARGKMPPIPQIPK